jgi:hypothetical protein
MSRRQLLIIYASLYLLAIPVYAALYYYYSDDFFHSTIQHEQYLEKDELKILSTLKNSMVKNYIEVNNTDSLRNNSFYNLTDFEFYNLKFKDGYYSFDLMANVNGRQEELPPSPLNLQFTLFWGRYIEDGKGKMYNLTLSDNKIGNGLLKKLFPVNKKYSGGTQSEEVGFIIISDSLKQDLFNHRNAMAGFPSKGLDNFWRMLYLSSATMTTVGYGDIVPVSSTTRLLISSQAILGLLLIGMFLNVSIKREDKGKST